METTGLFLFFTKLLCKPHAWSLNLAFWVTWWLVRLANLGVYIETPILPPQDIFSIWQFIYEWARQNQNIVAA